MVVLPPHPSSSAEARAYVAGRLQGTAAAVEVDRAVLVATELVTNAALHAGTTIHMEVVLGDDKIRIEVADTARTMPKIATRPPDAVDGRGLKLVDALADGGWGVATTAHGKVVWAVLRVAPDCATERVLRSSDPAPGLS